MIINRLISGQNIQIIVNMCVFSQSSPKPLCPTGRTNDIDAVIHIIDTAKKYVHIAVMDYFPLYIYTRHLQ